MPNLNEDGSCEQVIEVGGFKGQQGFQRKYDPFSSTYNRGWRDHPNFSYSGNQKLAVPNMNLTRPPGFFQPRAQQAYQPQLPLQNLGSSMEDIVKTLASNSLQFQQEIRTSIRSLETQVSQLANTVGMIEAQGSGKIPSQIVINPKENVSAITLRGGKQLDEMPRKGREAKGETK